MMTTVKRKKAAGTWFNALAALTGLVGLIAAFVSSSMTTTYTLGNLPQIALLSVCGIVLSVLAALLPLRFGSRDLLGSASVLGAIALYTAAFGSVLAERILLIAGLFSYDSVNTVGWQVFYATCVSFAGFLIADLALIIGAFLENAKEIA